MTVVPAYLALGSLILTSLLKLLRNLFHGVKTFTRAKLRPKICMFLESLMQKLEHVGSYVFQVSFPRILLEHLNVLLA